MEKEKCNKSRILYLDYTRGFAILLVIIGHLIQFNFLSGINNRLFDIIYSFHMPLFFFISGYARSINNKKSSTIFELLKTVYHKFQALIIPSVVWTLVIPHFFSYKYDFIITEISSYWFLNVLFAIVVVWDFFLYLECKRSLSKYLHVTMIIGIIVLFVLDVKRIPITYFLMYIIGYYFQKYNCLMKLKPIVYSLLFLIFCLLSGFFDYGDTAFGDANRVWLQFPLSICASLALLKFFSMYEGSKFKVFNVLGMIGRYTLGIYLCHFVLINISFVSYIENEYNLFIQFCGLLFLSFCISLLCIGIQKVVEAYPFLHKIMYGK